MRSMFVSPTYWLIVLLAIFWTHSPQIASANVSSSVHHDRSLRPTTQSGPPSVDVSDVIVDEGDQAQVTVTLNSNGTDVTAIDLDVNYDTACLSVDNIDVISGITGISGASEIAAGRIRIVFASYEITPAFELIFPPLPDATLVTITFDTICAIDAGGSTVVDLSVSDTNVGDDSGDPIPGATVTGGSVTIQSTLPDPDPDGDGVLDPLDNCPSIFNPLQDDYDGDLSGDACDLDDDDDGQSDLDEVACSSDPQDENDLAPDLDGDNSPDCVDSDDDGDGDPDIADNCPLIPNDDQLNFDNDALGDVCDPDDDGDGTNDVDDAFPFDPTETTDTDGDNTGNNADTDDDGDNQSDADEVACLSDPLDENSTAADNDGDNIPDCVDPDDDNDGQSDLDEAACSSDPNDENSKALDNDGDNSPDCVDLNDDNDSANDVDDAFPFDPTETTDTDGDGTGDNADNCPAIPNPNQLNFDNDPLGDVCDPDDDGDGANDVDDAFPLDPAETTDTDGDGTGDNADTDDDGDNQSDTDEIACLSDPKDENSTASDIDGDGSPDCVDPDDDGDGKPDTTDNCPVDSNANQENNDQDALGDACDLDDDNDSALDIVDNCVFVANPDQANEDGDELGNACDTDDDDDGKPDAVDNCPLIANPQQEDADSDGAGDACDTNNADPDTDDDSINDGGDNCPTVPNADQANLDGDSLGDLCDPDDDNDTIPDAEDNCPRIANKDQTDADGDGLGAACDESDAPQGEGQEDQDPDESNRSPISVNDVVTTNEDTPIKIQVLDNDMDPDGDPLTLSLTVSAIPGTSSVPSHALHGQIQQISETVIEYIPDLNFHGTDVFSYTIADPKGATAIGQVQVTVNALNDPPTIQQSSAPNQINSPGECISVFILAVDPDEDQSLTYSAVGLPAGLAIDPATGEIYGTIGASGTPARCKALVERTQRRSQLAPQKDYAVTISVTDTQHVDSTTFIWSVSDEVNSTTELFMPVVIQ